jgi:hypothetical protein
VIEVQPEDVLRPELPESIEPTPDHDAADRIYEE